MKSMILKMWIMIAVVLGVISPLSAAYVSLTNPKIAPGPLDPIERNGVGVITFGMVETLNAAAPATDTLGETNMQISLEMNKLALTGANVANITGTLLTYFSVSYDAGGNRLTFTQTTEFPGFGDANVTIPVDVTANSASSDSSLNGFNANISAADADTTADGNAAEFTYTKNVVDAINDTGTPVNGSTGGTAVADVADNDTFNGDTVVPGDVEITTVTNDTPLVLNLSNGEVTVPPGTPVGVYIETYTLCEIGEPLNCDEANVTVEVLASPIDAIDDDGGTVSGIAGGVAISNITTNDKLNNLPVVFTDVTITDVTNDTPLVVDKTTGSVTVPAGTPAGTYIETYTVCENLNISNCDNANITVIVSEAILNADNDNGGPISGLTGGSAISDITDNDTINGVPVTFSNVTITNVTNNTPLVVNAATGEVTVPPNTPSGPYVETYTICENLNLSSNCDTAEITVMVLPSEIEAVNDSNDSVDGKTGGVAIDDITDNDIFNGSPLVLGTDANITTVTTTTLLVVDKDTGSVTVPPNTPSGTYVEMYTICENLNPTNCETATITVVVVDAVPDYIPTLYAQGTIIAGTQGDLDLVVRIGEFNDGVNFNGDLMFTIVKNTNLDLHFNPTEGMRQGKIMENVLWTLTETSGLYIFKYIGNSGMFPSFSASRIGLSGSFTSPNSAKGQFPLDVTIVGGTGEEILGNNKDTDILEYNNLSS